MSGPAIKVATISEAQALEALAPAWAALFDEAPAAKPFQSPAWLMSWIGVFAPEDLRVFAAFEGDGLVGLAPFFIHRDRQTGARQLTLVGNGVSDHLDLLAAPARVDEVAAALSGWLGAGNGWDCLDFRDVPAGSPLLTVPLPVGRERIEPEEPCPALDLPDDPDDVLARLHKKRRYDVRHGVARLTDMGEVRFEDARAEPARAAIFQSLVDLHTRRWAERGQDGIFSDPRDAAFHETATRALLGQGMLRLHSVTLDGRTVAAHYALMHGATAFSYIHSFDPDYAACQPGAVLTAHVMEQAVREGARRFDFLRGREAYKYRWGAIDRPKHRRRAWR